jgi:hypothetical protein
MILGFLDLQPTSGTEFGLETRQQLHTPDSTSGDLKSNGLAGSVGWNSSTHAGQGI